MPNTKPMTGRELGAAICKHFGLSADHVQSDYRIKTAPGELASVTLTISLTPDDLAGIARKAGATIHRSGYLPADLRLVGEKGAEVIHTPLTGSTSRPGGSGSAQELKIKVDADEAAALIKGAGDDLSRVFRDGVSTLLDIAGQASAEMIHGEALPLEPDPRLDEIVSLLKRIDAHLHAPIQTVSVVPGR